jgi:hypothetical protein
VIAYQFIMIRPVINAAIISCIWDHMASLECELVQMLFVLNMHGLN